MRNGETLKEAESRLRQYIDEHQFVIVFVTFVAIVALWIVTLLLVILFGEFGTAGDSFGVVTSLFTGLSLFGIVAALLIQRRDLLASLDEMKQSTRALEKQAEAASREREENFREFASTFHSDRMKLARNTAYRMRKRFFTDGDFRTYLARQWIDLESIEAEESAGKRFDLPASNGGSVSLGHTWGLSDIIEYYSSLYHHCISFEPQKREHLAKLMSDRYIWGYWRGMLLIHAYNAARLYKDLTSNDDKLADQFPKPGWIEDLYRFDKLSGMKTYEPGIHPREACYSPGRIEFDEDFLIQR